MMLKPRRVNLKTDQRGIALITVLIIMLVLTILSTGVIVISVSNLNQTKTTVDHNQSYYVAEAGVNAMVSKFESNLATFIGGGTTLDQVLPSIQSWITASGTSSMDLNLTDGSNSNGRFTASISLNEVERSLQITSTGTVDGVSRTLRKNILISGINIDKAILTEGDLYINMDDIFMNTTTVLGEVQTLTGDAGTVQLDQLAKVGVVYIPTPVPPLTIEDVIPDCTLIQTSPKYMCETGNKLQFEVRFDDTTMKPLPSVTLPEIPVVSTTTDKLNPISIQMYDKKGKPITPMTPLVSSTGAVLINSSTVNSGYNYTIATGNSPKTAFYAPSFRVEGTVSGFTIDVGNKDIEIYTDSLYLGGSFNIKGTETGSLTIYVNSAAKFTTNCGNATCGAIKTDVGADPLVADAFIIVVSGTEGTELGFSGNGTFYFSLITNLDVDFAMNGTWTFNGFLTTGGDNINFGGTPNGNLLVYAPDALVTMSGNATLTGAIYADSYVSNGNSVRITYSDKYSHPPFEFLNPLSNMFYGSTIEQ